MRHARTALVGATVLSAAAAVVGAAPAVAVPADLPTCTTTGSGLQNEVLASDDGTAVLVGGDYVAHPAAAESEGRLLVAGTTTVDAGHFNVGRVGVGSGVVALGDVVVSAGDVTVEEGSVLDVNHGVDGGGDVRSGGDVSGSVELNGGRTVAPDAEAADDVAAQLAVLAEVSADLGALPATGTLTTVDGFPALRGDGSSDPQVFELTTAQAADLDAVTFADVGDAAVVVNVRGDHAVLDTVHTAAGTLADRIDDGTALGAWAPRILWNVTDATTLELGGHGPSQLVGSILAPVADVVQDTHTNGRLWVGGDLDLGARGTAAGLEHHNFPWQGHTRTTCDPGPSVPTPTPSQTPTPEPSATEPAVVPSPSESPDDEPTTGPTTGPNDGPDPEPTTSAGAATIAPGAGDDGTDGPVDEGDGDGATISAGQELPRTGASVGALLVGVAALIATGAAILLWRRRVAAR